MSLLSFWYAMMVYFEFHTTKFFGGPNFQHCSRFRHFYSTKFCPMIEFLVQCSNRTACANIRPSRDTNGRLVYFTKNIPQGNQHYCQKNFALGVPWDKTKARESTLRDCPRNAYDREDIYFTFSHTVSVKLKSVKSDYIFGPSLKFSNPLFSIVDISE